MLPHSEDLTLPLREGIRGLRSRIRSEARSGSVSSRLIGAAEPSRQLARLADGVLTQAERVAREVLPREGGDLGDRLDRMAAGLDRDAQARTSDTYAVCRALLERDGTAGLLVSELALATADGARSRLGGGDDPFLNAARLAAGLAASGMVRPHLSPVSRPGADRADASARIALGCWLAVLVRRESGAPAPAVVEAAICVLDAEGEDWARLLRARRLGELASIWRATVPHLP